MVCEVMAGTLLYGTTSLFTACATTAIVPAFYRVNEPYEHGRGNSIQREMKISARPCPCLKEKDG